MKAPWLQIDVHDISDHIVFVDFVKGIPLEIEEATVIDGCGPFRTYFLVVFPMFKSIMISVGILEIMWAWND